MRLFWIILLGTSMLACSQGADFINVAQISVRETCDCEVEITSSVNIGGKKSEVELNLRMNQNINEAQLYSSVVAFNFGFDIIKSGNKLPDKTVVILNYEDFKKGQVEFVYDKETLTNFIKQSKVLKKHIDFLINGSYDLFVESMKNDEQFSNEDLINHLVEIDRIQGKITNVHVMGYGYFKKDNNKEFINVRLKIERASKLYDASFTYDLKNINQLYNVESE